MNDFSTHLSTEIVDRSRGSLRLFGLAALLSLWSLDAAAQLEGMIDVHVHNAPDSVGRSIDAIETARMAERHGMRALLFKNHYVPTAQMAYLVSRVVSGVEVYGAIALNRSVGGINPTAVEHMIRTTGGLGRLVFMPTFDSEHGHLTNTPNPNHVPITSRGRLLPEVLEVLELIAEHDLALATGHSSPSEVLELIRAGRAAGINRIIVTHPSSELVHMSTEQQAEAATLGALLEYPIALALPGAALSVEDFAGQIKAVGAQNVVLSTDLGQVGNPVHTDGLVAFLPRLRAAGITAAEIDLMTRSNPARILGLD